MKTSTHADTVQRTTVVGGIGNLALTAFKFVVGILGHSAAMIADAVHSLSDLVTDVIVVVFVRLSDRPVDADHSYGHGKYETLATTLVAVLLFCVGAGICVNGASDIIKAIKGEPLGAPGMIALIGALISIVVKEILFQYTVRVGRKIDSPVLIANAWHHRSDAFSSIATAVGIGGAILLGKGWHVLDPIAATLVSFFIMKVAIDIVKPSIQELLEKSLPEEVNQEILKTADSFKDVVQPHNLRTRRVGRVNVVDLHVRMPAQMSVEASHDVVSEMERRMRKFLGADAIINIHVEPIKKDRERTEDENRPQTPKPQRRNGHRG